MNKKNSKIKYILASKSKRRREILSNNGFDFDIIESPYELDIIGKSFDDNLVLDCAKEKAKSVYNIIINDNNYDNIKKEYENIIIIASDTIVVADNVIIGKPKNKQNAYEILKQLSNKTHFVETSICLIKICDNNDYKIMANKNRTYVTFRKITDDEIYNYIEKYEPYDKAGSYGIQDEGNDFVISIDGDIDTVIGFSIKTFDSLLKSIMQF